LPIKEIYSIFNHIIKTSQKLMPLKYSFKLFKLLIISIKTTFFIEISKYFFYYLARKYFTRSLIKYQIVRFWLGSPRYHEEKIHFLWYLLIYGTLNDKLIRIWLFDRYLGIRSAFIWITSRSGTFSCLNFIINEIKDLSRILWNQHKLFFWSKGFNYVNFTI